MAEMKGMLLSGEYNPFFYLCMRYYGDVLPVCINQNGEDNLPPLAVLHQYQRERIRSQRGTFTIFPNYILPKSLNRTVYLNMIAEEWSVSLLSRIVFMKSGY